MASQSFGQAPPGIMDRAAAPLPPIANKSQPPPLSSSASLPALPRYDRGSVYVGRTPLLDASALASLDGNDSAMFSPRPGTMVKVSRTPVAQDHGKTTEPSAAPPPLHKPAAFDPTARTRTAKPPIEKGITINQLEEHYTITELQQFSRDVGMIASGTHRVLANKILTYLDGGLHTTPGRTRRPTVAIDVVPGTTTNVPPPLVAPSSQPSTIARPKQFALASGQSSSSMDSGGTRNVLLELSLEGLESLKEAADCAVDRVELCANLSEGGTTPSVGTIWAAKRLLARMKSNCKLFVLIRPRPGNFAYSEDELEAMKYDIKKCKEIGVDGVVLGALTRSADSSWDIDDESTSALVKTARPLAVTFHRAFDLLPESSIQASLESLIHLGVETVLTSGLKSSAIEGASKIAKLVKIASGRIDIMAGAGVTHKNVAKLIEETDVKSVHVGSSVWSIRVDKSSRTTAVSFKDPGVVDAERVRALMKAAGSSKKTFTQPPPPNIESVHTKTGGMAAPAPISLPKKEDAYYETSTAPPNVEGPVALSDDRKSELEKMERMMEDGTLSDFIGGIKKLKDGEGNDGNGDDGDDIGDGDDGDDGGGATSPRPELLPRDGPAKPSAQAQPRLHSSSGAASTLKSKPSSSKARKGGGEKAVRCKKCGDKFPKRLVLAQNRCPGCGFSPDGNRGVTAVKGISGPKTVKERGVSTLRRNTVVDLFARSDSVDEGSVTDPEVLKKKKELDKLRFKVEEEEKKLQALELLVSTYAGDKKGRKAAQKEADSQRDKLTPLYKRRDVLRREISSLTDRPAKPVPPSNTTAVAGTTSTSSEDSQQPPPLLKRDRSRSMERLPSSDKITAMAFPPPRANGAGAMMQHPSEVDQHAEAMLPTTMLSVAEEEEKKRKDDELAAAAAKLKAMEQKLKDKEAALRAQELADTERKLRDMEAKLKDKEAELHAKDLAEKEAKLREMEEKLKSAESKLQVTVDGGENDQQASGGAHVVEPAAVPLRKGLLEKNDQDKRKEEADKKGKKFKFGGKKKLFGSAKKKGPPPSKITPLSVSGPTSVKKPVTDAQLISPRAPQKVEDPSTPLDTADLHTSAPEVLERSDPPPKSGGDDKEQAKEESLSDRLAKALGSFSDSEKSSMAQSVGSVAGSAVPSTARPTRAAPHVPPTSRSVASLPNTPKKDAISLDGHDAAQKPSKPLPPTRGGRGGGGRGGGGRGGRGTGRGKRGGRGGSVRGRKASVGGRKASVRGKALPTPGGAKKPLPSPAGSGGDASKKALPSTPHKALPTPTPSLPSSPGPNKRLPSTPSKSLPDPTPGKPLPPLQGNPPLPMPTSMPPLPTSPETEDDGGEALTTATEQSPLDMWGLPPLGLDDMDDIDVLLESPRAALSPRDVRWDLPPMSGGMDDLLDELLSDSPAAGAPKSLPQPPTQLGSLPTPPTGGKPPAVPPNSKPPVPGGVKPTPPPARKPSRGRSRGRRGTRGTRGRGRGRARGR